MPKPLLRFVAVLLACSLVVDPSSEAIAAMQNPPSSFCPAVRVFDQSALLISGFACYTRKQPVYFRVLSVMILTAAGLLGQALHSQTSITPSPPQSLPELVEKFEKNTDHPGYLLLDALSDRVERGISDDVLLDRLGEAYLTYHKNVPIDPSEPLTSALLSPHDPALYARYHHVLIRIARRHLESLEAPLLAELKRYSVRRPAPLEEQFNEYACYARMLLAVDDHEFMRYRSTKKLSEVFAQYGRIEENRQILSNIPIYTLITGTLIFLLYMVFISFRDRNYVDKGLSEAADLIKNDPLITLLSPRVDMEKYMVGPAPGVSITFGDDQERMRIDIYREGETGYVLGLWDDAAGRHRYTRAINGASQLESAVKDLLKQVKITAGFKDLMRRVSLQKLREKLLPVKDVFKDSPFFRSFMEQVDDVIATEQFPIEENARKQFLQGLMILTLLIPPKPKKPMQKEVGKPVMDNGSIELLMDDGIHLANRWYPSIDRSQPDAPTIVVVAPLAKPGVRYENLVRSYRRIFHSQVNVLLLDQRAQGSSGGNWTSLGPMEALDLIKVLQILRARGDVGNQPILLHGISFGAVVCALALTMSRTVAQSFLCEVCPGSFGKTLIRHAQKQIQRRRFKEILAALYPAKTELQDVLDHLVHKSEETTKLLEEIIGAGLGQAGYRLPDPIELLESIKNSDPAIPILGINALDDQVITSAEREMVEHAIHTKNNLTNMLWMPTGHLIGSMREGTFFSGVSQGIYTFFLQKWSGLFRHLDPPARKTAHEAKTAA